MRKQTSRQTAVWLFMTAAVIFMVARLSQRSRYPFKGLLRKAMKERYGADQAENIVGKVLARYEELYRGRRHYQNRTLQTHLEKTILPTLALYQVLQGINPDQEALLREMEAFLEMPFAVPMKIIPLMRFFPDPFAVFRTVFPWVMKAFPPEGWDNEWVENNDRAIAFNTRGCFILNVLTEYGAHELTPAFCHSDDLIARAFPASIHYTRSGTLGRGDACCDFRYERA